MREHGVGVGICSESHETKRPSQSQMIEREKEASSIVVQLKEVQERRPMSPSNDPVLASRLCSVTSWEQPMQRAARARMQKWVSEHSIWGLCQLSATLSEGGVLWGTFLWWPQILHWGYYIFNLPSIGYSFIQLIFTAWIFCAKNNTRNGHVEVKGRVLAFKEFMF